ncbi:fimbria/pilus outer membrane usher protein [Paraburkholderia sp.]|uniref:fimbria/pilus outer membrane usher protein n=1 Tax=Paraburkholderia sp. TaxID=1926495 RepID=UPI0023901059|nr:fimbria/pilus outer membrane usher protein [Paraburkholderia sp.]MDE1182787.1 fimbria/pilus outer membrane usher protein [Paraburkholderia sp.]
MRTPRRLTRHRWTVPTMALAASLIAAGGTPARAQNASPVPDRTAATHDSHDAHDTPDTARDLYLEVNLNGQRTALIAHFRERGGKLFASAKDLSEIGLLPDRLAGSSGPPHAPGQPGQPTPPASPPPASPLTPPNAINMAGPAATDALNALSDVADIALDSLPGLRYTYDPATQSVDLDAPDNLRRPYTFDTRALTQTPLATSSRGFVLNYDAYAQSESTAQLALWSEERYFDPSGVFSNTGIAYLYRDLHRYIRYDTSWSRSDPATLTTQQYGDTISSSLDWTRSVRIGGFQWRSNFTLRPDLVTFPVPALTGSAVVPSSVDLYINNVRQYSGNVPSGPFVVTNVPGITGGGQATVITRDALGRTIATSVPLYVDTRMLAQGLSSYSFEVGFLRRSYGVESFDYNPHPAISGSLRRGLSDTLTIEGHAEATSGLANAGAGALVRLGMAGVVSGSLAASAGHRGGVQTGLGYQIIEPSFSIDAQTLRAFGHYGDIASADGTPVADATDRVTLSVPLFSRQTLALSYIGYRYPQVSASHIGSVSYTVSFGNLASLTLSAFRDFSGSASSGVFLSASLGLGNNTSVSSSVGRQNGQSSYNINANRPPDYDGGFGWAAQVGGTSNVPYRQAQAQYLGKYGEVTAIAQSLDRHTSASVDVSGALVVMDGSVLPARRIGDGFALISTGGVAGIPVLHENRVIGTTDRNGHLLVPDLNAYESNRVGIDSMNLPADAQIASTTQDLVPKSQSGVLASFRVTRYSAASVILQGPDGKLLPAGARVHHRESGSNTIVGYDGLTFIENLQADNHLEIEAGALHCTVAFAYTRPTNGSLPTYGPLTCRPL